jgi:hypothetical protein
LSLIGGEVKYSVTLLVLLLFIGCPFAPSYYRLASYRREQQITLSEKIGDVLDAMEREQYELFPSVDSFDEARFFAIGGGGYVVDISAGSRRFVSVNRDPSAIKIIRYYIADYELIKSNRAAFEKRWQIVGYDDLGQPITDTEIENMGLMGSTGPCLLGVAGGGCVGLFTGCAIGSYVYGYNIWAGETENESPVYFIVGTVGGALAGGALSAYLYRRKVIQNIKDSRRLWRID